MERNLSLVTWIAIIAFVMQAMLAIFIGFLPSNGLATTIPQLSQINGYESSMSMASKNIASAFNLNTIPPSNCNAGDIVCQGYALGAGIYNFIFSVVSFFVNLGILFGLGIIIVVFLMVAILPSLLLSLQLGIISDILVALVGVVDIIIAYYVFILLLELYKAISPFASR